MPRVSCPRCDKRLTAKASLAGRKVICPGCKKPMYLPDDDEEPPKPRPKRPAADEDDRPRSRRPTRPEDDEPLPRRSRASARDDDDDGLAPVRRKKKKHRKKAAGPELWIILGGIGAVFVVTILIALFVKGGSLGLLILGGILGAIGQFWFLQIAHREGPSVAFMIRWVPFYSFYFFFTRIEQTLKPFLLQAAGAIVVVVGVIIMIARGDHRDRDERPGRDPVAVDRGPTPAERARQADEFNKRPDRAEARAWLAAGAGRSLLGEEPADARRHVQQLYNLGAKEVLVADVEVTESRTENAQQVLIVLPDDPNQRRAIFDYLRQDLEPDARDTGQKSILLS